MRFAISPANSQNSARVTTRITMWKHAVTGEDFPVDAPDTVTVAGVLENGAEAAYQVASVPYNASGTSMEIYGRKGTLRLTSNSVNIGPSRLFMATGADELAELTPPDDYILIPKDMAAGPGRNVAQAYARFAQARAAGKKASPDFDDAVVRHAMIDAMERSHVEGKVVRLASGYARPVPPSALRPAAWFGTCRGVLPTGTSACGAWCAGCPRSRDRIAAIRGYRRTRVASRVR